MTTESRSTQKAARSICEVCGADVTRDWGRCTNRRCSECHRKHCGPGGEVSPGHSRGAVETPFAEARHD